MDARAVRSARVVAIGARQDPHPGRLQPLDRLARDLLHFRRGRFARERGLERSNILRRRKGASAGSTARAAPPPSLFTLSSTVSVGITNTLRSAASLDERIVDRLVDEEVDQPVGPVGDRSPGKLAGQMCTTASFLRALAARITAVNVGSSIVLQGRLNGSPSS